jgi:NAD(P)-dependent dehydrogenase (short-subunit alcohol dehydrogenase family)
MTTEMQPVAVVTGGSRGLGEALARALLERGWRVVVDARDTSGVAGKLPGAVVLTGDVTDAAHRRAVADAVRSIGRLDLLVNNASALGSSPLPPLADYPLSAFRAVYETNVVAPLGLIQELLPMLRASRGSVVNVSSDAAVEAYAGWGGYGSSKAALDQVGAVLAVEEPDIAVHAVDPGDMRTAMHQAAFPGDDISDRPEPDAIVPAILRLLDARPASARHRASDWALSEVGS